MALLLLVLWEWSVFHPWEFEGYSFYPQSSVFNPLEYVLSFSDLWIEVFQSFWKRLSYYLLKYCLFLIICVLPWDSNYIYARPLAHGPRNCYAITWFVCFSFFFSKCLNFDTFYSHFFRLINSPVFYSVQSAVKSFH